MSQQMKETLQGVADKLDLALTVLELPGMEDHKADDAERVKVAITESICTLREVLESFEAALTLADSNFLKLNRQEMTTLRGVYEQNEQRGKDFVEKTTIEMRETTEKEREDKRIVREMYLYQQGKAAGMKEAIDEMFFKIDGKFPKYSSEGLQEK